MFQKLNPQQRIISVLTSILSSIPGDVGSKLGCAKLVDQIAEREQHV